MLSISDTPDDLYQVTMIGDISALKAVMDKSPKLDGRRCNVNLAYIGQKKKVPSSKKPDLKLKNLCQIQGQVFNYNSNGYLVSPNIFTPSGQYYQLGLPPLHGHQPVYQIPQSPSQVCYEPTETYLGHSPIPPSPMSPMYQQPVYYNYTQPFVIGNCPPGGTIYQAPPPNAVYQTTVVSSNDLNHNDVSSTTANNNIVNNINNNNIKNTGSIDLNNNSNNIIHQSNTATTTVVPSTYGLGSAHHPAPYSPPAFPVVSSTTSNLNLAGTYTGVATDTRPLVVNGKANNTSDLAMTQIHANHPQITNNNTTVQGNAGNIALHPTPVASPQSVHLINGGAILHPQIVGVPAHNVAVTTFVTQSLPTSPMQSQNQGPVYHHIPSQTLPPQGAYLQQREVVM